MKAQRADWAAQVPFNGIQSLPAAVARLASGGILISDVQGLQEILNELEPGGGSVAWANITGKPSFGSAAYADVDNFEMAWTDKTFQQGDIDFVNGQRSYDVVFDPVMKADPAVDITMYISDGTSEEMFYGAIQNKDVNGFTLWLNAAPTVDRGWCHWRAKVE